MIENHRIVFTVVAVLVTTTLVTHGAAVSQPTCAAAELTEIPRSFRIIFPRGDHLVSTSFGRGGAPVAEWKRNLKAPQLAVRLTTAENGEDWHQRSAADGSDIYKQFRVGVRLNESTTTLHTQHCQGWTNPCILELPQVVANGAYALLFHVSVESEVNCEEGHTGTTWTPLPTKAATLNIVNGLALRGIRYTQLPSYMVAGHRYTIEMVMMDDRGIPIDGATPFEGSIVKLDGWLRDGFLNIATAVIVNSVALFEGVTVPATFSQSVALVATVGSVRTEPTPLVVHFCPREFGQLLLVEPSITMHSSAIKVEISAPQPRPLVPRFKRTPVAGPHFCRFGPVTVVATFIDPCKVRCTFPAYSQPLPRIGSQLEFEELSTTTPRQLANVSWINLL